MHRSDCENAAPVKTRNAKIVVIAVFIETLQRKKVRVDTVHLRPNAQFRAYNSTDIKLRLFLIAVNYTFV
jgi:hypothetical protein